uniref:Nkap_C domain-containing protein n=1 Tax=Heterorhabditis bacteriophora TaxID=37862 RepID=A0A1I7XV58_HETBA
MFTNSLRKSCDADYLLRMKTHKEKKSKKESKRSRNESRDHRSKKRTRESSSSSGKSSSESDVEEKFEHDKKTKEKESYLPPQLAYTNTNNPFNDAKLTETFIWGKKLEQEGKISMSRKQIERE